MSNLNVTLNELSSNANKCSLRRKRNIITGSSKSDNYFKSILIKSIIKSYFEGGFKNQEEQFIFENQEEINLYNFIISDSTQMVNSGKLNPAQFWFYVNIRFELERGFLKISYPSELTRRIHSKEALRYVFRYLNSEKRRPYFYRGCDIDIHGVTVSVAPDFVFFNEDGSIEVVKIKVSKPSITQKGKKNGADKDLGLYAMLKYGESLVKYGEERVVKASYYYLRKANDSFSNEKPKFDEEFFQTEGGKNIISISTSYTPGLMCVYGKEECSEEEKAFCPFAYSCGAGFESEADRKCREMFKQFSDGAECSEEDCTECDFYRVCRYNHSPIAITKERVVKSIRDLSLTEQQEKAIGFNKGLARANAGAGAGKTLVVALRTVTLLSNGVKPSEICLVTFTNTGAEEMRERIALYNDDFGTGQDISDLVSTTFNAFGDKIIKEEYPSLGFAREPRLIDDIERSVIIKGLISNEGKEISGLDYRNFNMNTKNCIGALGITKRVFEIIKKKNYNFGDEKLIEKDLGTNKRFLSLTAIATLIERYNEYDKILKDECLIEFADQELLVFELLRKNPYFFDDIGFKHIIVDEFQDSNELQIALVKTLRNTPNFESLMVVGDDSQAIFGFRDTSPENIINFFSLMGEDGEDFFLLENHRSTPEIIDFANKLDRLNKHRINKDLIATRPNGKKPIIRGFWTKEEEYSYIVENILEKVKEGHKYEDIAFIGSNKYELIEMGDRLAKAGVPAVMLNPELLIENSRVLAAIDLVQFLKDPTSTQSILNYANAELGGKLLECTDEEIQKIIEAKQIEARQFQSLPAVYKRKKFHELLDAVNEEDDEVYTKFTEALKAKVSLEKEFEYCENFAEYGTTSAVKREKNYPGVVLTTAHSSKGLEWPVVFNTITKYDTKEARKHEKDIEEKRRLLFVSATRARDELYITGQYVSFGAKDDRTYNKFLIECYGIMEMEFNPIEPSAEEKEENKKEASWLLKKSLIIRLFFIFIVFLSY